MVGKNQVIVEDNHGHETKVHRRDLKVIDSNTKVAEMYDELRKERRRDAQHCMPVKQIPDLNWEKENIEKDSTDLNAKTKTENRTGPTLRSSKRKQTVNEIKEQVEAASKNEKEKNLCRVSFSSRHCYSRWSIHRSITIHYLTDFLITDSPNSHLTQAIEKNITHTKWKFKTNK